MPESHAPSDRSSRKPTREQYLSIPEVADSLGTTERFARRLIAERRIAFHRFGRHVRIARSVLDAYIEDSAVTPITRRPGRRAA